MKKYLSIALLLFFCEKNYAQTNIALPAVDNAKAKIDTSINKTDKSGLKQGIWKETSGSVKIEGFYLNDKKQ